MEQDRSNRGGGGGGGGGGIAGKIKNMFTRRTNSSQSFEDLSNPSRRFEGSRRFYDGSLSGRFGDRSTGKDSSTRSILFDLELSHRGMRVSTDLSTDLSTDVVAAAAASVSGSPTAGGSQGASIHRLRNLAKPLSTFEVDLLQDVQALAGSLRDANDGNLPIDELASDLTAMGYECAIQCVESHGLGDTHANYGSVNRDAKCLELLRHEFILCAGLNDGSVEHSCVVDPSFREQFTLGQHNETYEKLLLAIPQEFVGSPIRLQALVTVICSEMVKVYQELGVSLPPWRRPRSVLGKWFDVEADQAAKDNYVGALGCVVGTTAGVDSGARAGSGGRTSSSNSSGATGGARSRNSGKGSLMSRVRSTFGGGRSSGDFDQGQAAEAVNIASEKSNKPRRDGGAGVGKSVSLLARRLAGVGDVLSIDLGG